MDLKTLHARVGVPCPINKSDERNGGVLVVALRIHIVEIASRTPCSIAEYNTTPT